MYRMNRHRLALATTAACVLLLLLHRSNALGNPVFKSISTPRHALQSSKLSVSKAWLRNRMALSEKSWQWSIELRMSMGKKHRAYPDIPFFPQDFARSPFTIWNFFPATWTCPFDVQRVGGLGDGGKWICGMSVYEQISGPAVSQGSPSTGAGFMLDPQKGLVVYSFGINHDSAFEADLLKRVPSAQIWGYDPSVRGWGYQVTEKDARRAYFNRAGLSGDDRPNDSPPFRTLSALMEDNGHDYIDILKLDIEGSEFAALDTLIQSIEDTRTVSGLGILPIGQMLIELHLGNGTHHMEFTRLRIWWERLEEMGMRPTWMEINLLSVTLHKDRRSPDCAEYVFVNVEDQRNILWK